MVRDTVESCQVKKEGSEHAICSYEGRAMARKGRIRNSAKLLGLERRWKGKGRFPILSALLGFYHYVYHCYRIKSLERTVSCL